VSVGRWRRRSYPTTPGHTPWAHLAADRNTLRVWKQRRARIARR